MGQRKLYHITNPENKESILKYGIKCSDDGYIYLVSEEKLSDLCSSFDFVAAFQLHILEYQIFEISETGIGGKLTKEIIDGAESSCQFQLKQQRIKNNHITDCGTRKVNDTVADNLQEKGMKFDGNKKSPKQVHSNGSPII